MTYNENKLRYAFIFREIMEKIASIEWGKLITWYIVMGTTYFIYAAIISVIYYIFSLISPFFAGIVQSLIFIPYAYIFIARSVALIYMPENEVRINNPQFE